MYIMLKLKIAVEACALLNMSFWFAFVEFKA